MLASEAKLSFNYVESRIVSEATRITKDPAQPEAESALKAAKVAKRVDTPTKTCSRHGLCYHTSDQCKVLKEEAKRKRKEKKGKLKKKEKANWVDEASSSESQEDKDDEDEEQAQLAIPTYKGHTVSVSKRLAERISAYTASSPISRKNRIVIDSGASAHIILHLSWLDPNSYKALDPPRKIRFGDNSCVEAVGIGNLQLKCQVGKHIYVIKQENVLLAPSFAVSLISVHQLAKQGLITTFGEKESYTKRRGGAKVMTARHHQGLYLLNAKPTTFTERESIAVDINVLHRRMGHTNLQKLRRMVASGKLQDVDRVTGKPQFCEPCVLGKMKRLSLKAKRTPRAEHPFQLIHSDVGGPITPISREGFRYWITFTDDCTRFPWIYFMKHKSEARSIYHQWKSDIFVVFQCEVEQLSISENFIKWFRADGAGEYLGAEFETELQDKGVLHKSSAPYTQEQNGLSERMNQTLAYTATTMLVDSKLPKLFWADAMAAAQFITARVPTARLKGKSLYECLFCRQVDTSYF